MNTGVHLLLGGCVLVAYVAALHWAFRPLKRPGPASARRAVATSLHALGQPQGQMVDDIQYRLMGALSGFPSCCVRAFCTTYCSETKAHYPAGPWMGTGFIPCLSCAPEAAKDFKRFVAEKISPNRLYAEPFPREPSSDTHDATMSLIAQLELDDAKASRPPPRTCGRHPQPTFHA